MATSLLTRRSRSTSPPSSNGSPASSHSSPSSSDFLPTDGAEVATPHWKSPASTISPFSPSSHLKTSATPVAVWSGQPGFDYAALPSTDAHKFKTDSDGEGMLFSEYIQEDAFDPTPLPPPGVSPHYGYIQQQESHIPPPGMYPAPSYPNTLSTSSRSSFPAVGSHPPTSSLLPPQTINPQTASHASDHGLSSNNASSSNSPQVASASLSTGPIYPPKSQCSDLLIYISNIPEQGAKSRVETQIKMDLELVKPFASSSSSGPVYKRVASWRWLRLSKGATTKRRPKKDGKQESNKDDTLYLSTEVICATAPHPQVHACSSCIGREAKRLERKKQTRVRPVRSDSSEDEGTSVPFAVAEQIRREEGDQDDGSRIVLFNCPELVDFSGGSVSLPVRITCYCRHHREKVGFRVIFTMRDSNGRIVGRGTTPPVMITDDHKSTMKNSIPDDDEEDGEHAPTQPKRKRRQLKKESEQDGDILMDGQVEAEVEEDDPKAKRRSKAAPGGRKQSIVKTKQGIASGRSSRLGTPSRRSSPSAPTIPRNAINIPAVSPYSSVPHVIPTSFDFNAMAANEVPGAHHDPSQSLAPPAPIYPTNMDGSLTSMDTMNHANNPHLSRPPSNGDLAASPFTSYQQSYPVSPPSAVATAPASPLSATRSIGSPGVVDPSLGMLANSLLSTNLFPNSMSTPSPQLATAPQPVPGMVTQAPTMSSNAVLPPAPPPPVIHRLIPNTGPTHGGIEVTILGSNFIPNLQCMFGDAIASSTEMWSENTMVAILPPSPSPGPVVVWFKDVPIPIGGAEVDGLLGLGGPPMLQWFTYTDNADRALMELALQVVGLKTTGRIEDAKNVAMRIVGAGNGMDLGSGNMGSGGGGQSMSGGNQLAEGLLSNVLPSSRRGSAVDVSIPNGPGRSRDFQSVIIEFLSLMDVELENAPSSIPVQDAISHPTPTGQTLLHLAAILGFHRLVTFLIIRGADIDVRDRNGFTALHFAAMCGRLACARILVTEGADLEVVESRGRSAKQLAQLHDQADVEALLEETEAANDSEYDGDGGDSLSAEDGEREDDAEEDEETGLWMGSRQTSPVAPSTGEEVDSVRPQAIVAEATRQSSALPSRTASHVTFADVHSTRKAESDLYSSDEDAAPQRPSTDILPPSVRALGPPDAQPPNEKPPSMVDASAAWMHRTLAHLKPPPAMVPDLPWGLGNIQMPGIRAFPMQMQMPAWPVWQAADGEKVRAYYDLASWRTWYGGATGTWWSEKTPAPPQVPMYTPSEDEVATPIVYEETEQQETPGAGSSKAVTRGKLARRLGYDPGELSDKDVNAYAHYSQKMKKLKQDRMLVLFWLPILLIVIAWGVYETLPVAFGAFRTSIRDYLPEPLQM